MKKNLLMSLCAGFGFFVSGFSQSNGEIIQRYINANAQKYQLNNQESKDWNLENITSSETTGIENCYIKQSYQGIDIFQSYIYFWIKDKQVINNPSGFISELSSKVNTVQPQLNVVEGFSRALTQLGEANFNSNIIENQGNKYKLSNGLLSEDPINAKLVYYQTTEKSLRLAWSYEFYNQSNDHLWYVQIDAQDGNILEKRDLVLRCNHEVKNHSGHNHIKELDSEFQNNFFKTEAKSTFLTPGTTNYRVIPWNYESPNHSARQLITNPEATTVLAPSTLAASPNGWHNSNNTIGGGTTPTQFNSTRGNNVNVYSDFNDIDSPGSPATYTNSSTGTYPNLTFDYPYNGTGTSPKTYVNAANTNLFYMNNIMHDLWYQYGFNEVNRNFQTSNYGRKIDPNNPNNANYGGNDPVNAESQDGSFLATPTYNNANFATPGDGSRPRMQMFLWTSGRKFSNLTVTSGSLSGTSYQVIENAFNEGHIHLPIAPSALTGTLQLVNDGSPDTSDACTDTTTGASLPAGSMTGKIAVIRRGSCPFNLKVKAVQDAGAIAAIIVNNTAGTISMAGDNPAITIPAVSITQTEGEALISAISSGTVNVSLSSVDSYAYADGDFDNGIIAHEYGHGISTRLVGGGNALASPEQPGEGWSDWFWLMMQIKPGDTRNDARGIGTFAVGQPTNGDGIREYRYSTDMAVNPHTFGDTNNQWYTDNGVDYVNVHGLGSIWAVMLWDLAWNYIDKYGYSSNIYNGTAGNNKVMRLVVDALKLTPANPSLIDCRNAIIAADQASTGGQDYCMIWKTFARRGMGVNASSGTNSGIAGVQDQVEDFTEPAPGPNCTLSVSQFDNSDKITIYPNPSNGLVNIKINSFIGKATVQVIDLNGRVVYSLNSTEFNNEKSIDLSHLQAGVYAVKISGDELNYTKKIILN
ncbi:T9SS-dependent M36 family metallopeptidase [Flavobacterium terrae]|nr:T9SS-dependent M36 family metallopeptidase [Flavobacterium terrae]